MDGKISTVKVKRALTLSAFSAPASRVRLQALLGGRDSIFSPYFMHSPRFVA